MHYWFLLYGYVSSASGQDEANPVIGYPSDGAILPARDYPRVPQEKFPRKPYNNLYWPSLFGQDGWILSSFFFCEFMDLDFVSVHKNAKKELGQYPAILTEQTWSITHTYNWFYYTLNSLSLFWLAESVRWIFEIRARDVITADYTIITSRTLKVTGKHVMYDRGAWFVTVIMSSSRALCCSPSVKEQKHDFNLSVQCIINQLLDSVFVISRIIEISVRFEVQEPSTAILWELSRSVIKVRLFGYDAFVTEMIKKA